jgi:threonine aldolase
MSALGGIHPHPVRNQADGTLALDDIRASIQMEDVHHTITRLVCIENTQNICGGVPLTADYTRQVGELAHANGLSLHVDGARLFNSAVAQNVSAQELVAPADSVMFCLSKGLAAPIGSMLVGTAKFIKRARHLRKMVGGGMRQVGIVAAAGIVSLESMIERLDEDHTRAKRLADGLSKVKGIVVDKGSPYTNMVYFDLTQDAPLNAEQIMNQLKDRGILVGPESYTRFRLVTHYWIDDAGVDQTVQAFADVLR